MIGNTPMIKINYRYNNQLKSIFTKLEYYNLTGSIKDRMAFYIIKEALANNLLKENQLIVEATSGNTGISFAAIGSLLNCPVHIFMPDWLSDERKQLLEAFGAKLHLVTREEGGFQKAIQIAEEFALKENAFQPKQFKNKNNILAHYFTTGTEIINQLDNIGGFVTGIGTGGTAMGVGKKLKEFNSNIKLIVLEPDSLPILMTGENTGTHKIQGIGDDFIPEIVDKNLIDHLVLVNDDDAINMANKLGKELGLGVGISSGANMIASILANEFIDNNIVTVFVDDNKKYLSTELAKKIDNNPNFVSNKIELINYEIYKTNR